MANDMYEGEVYFSETLPKGKDKGDKFNPVIYDMMESYLKDPKEYGSPIALQSLLVDLGYLDKDNPLSMDNKHGPMTIGAAMRYQTNYQDDAFRHEIKNSPSKLVNYLVDSAKGIFD